jgi:endonuclease/exonuclease/phosphatase (EEP) superfamily protein YafD
MAMIRRVFAAAFLVVLAIVLLIFAWPQLFGLGRTAIIAQVVSLRGLAAVLAFVVVVALGLFALVFAGARRFVSSVALLLLVFAGVNVAVLSTRGFSNLGFESPTGNSVTVLSWNTLGNAPGAQAIATLAIENKADIVILPETSEETAAAIAGLIANSGRSMQTWTVAYDKVSKAKSTSVLISGDLGAYQVDVAAKTTSVLPSIVATPVDGKGPTIVAVHAVSPIPSQLGNWQSDLAWLKSTCATGNVIMAGDFNSTIDNYSGLSTAVGATIGACTDAGQQSHNAAVGSWPTALPALLGTPIDHVMFTQGWRVSGMRVIESVDTAGSDHRPILVQLSPKG